MRADQIGDSQIHQSPNGQYQIKQSIFTETMKRAKMNIETIDSESSRGKIYRLVSETLNWMGNIPEYRFSRNIWYQLHGVTKTDSKRIRV